MAEIQIYDMATNASPDDGDFFEQDIVDTSLPAGRNNKKISLGATADFIGKTHNYTSDLQTTNKTLVGAINEVLNEGTSVSVTNVLPATETTKRVATITVDGVAKDVNADDADKILRAAFGEHTATGNPVTFDAFLGLEVASECKVTMNPIQDLSHGDPSPTNICPISGRDSVTVTRTAGEDVETHTHTYSTTVYGGVDDFVSGEGKKTHAYLSYDSFTRTNDHQFYKNVGSNVASRYGRNNIICDRMPTANSSIPTGTAVNAVHTNSSGAIVVHTEQAYSTASAFMTAMGGQLNFAVRTSAGADITNTPEDISLIKGVNVVSTDADSLELKYSADIKAYIDSKLNA